jgi:RNA polymerase sigma-70 factor (ECF subfamily)
MDTSASGQRFDPGDLPLDATETEPPVPTDSRVPSESRPAALSVVADGVLAARAAEGDVAAIEALIHRYKSLMRAVVACLLGSVSDADDVVQETLVLAWRQLSHLQDHSAVRSWLMRIATRQAITRLRARPKELPLVEPATVATDDNQPETMAIRNAELRALSHALDALSEDQRRCWLLREAAGLSYEDIAEEMGVSASTVRGKLARARSSLCVQMEGWR